MMIMIRLPHLISFCWKCLEDNVLKKLLSVVLVVLLFSSSVVTAFASSISFSSFSSQMYSAWAPYNVGDRNYIIPVYIASDDESKINSITSFLSEYDSFNSDNQTSSPTYISTFMKDKEDSSFVYFTFYRFSSFPRLTTSTSTGYYGTSKNTNYSYSSTTVQSFGSHIRGFTSAGILVGGISSGTQAIVHQTNSVYSRMSVLNYVPSGYSLHSSVPIASNINSIRFKLMGKAPKVTINLKLSNGDWAFPTNGNNCPRLLYCIPGNEYSFSPPSLPGYKPNTSLVSGIMPNEDFTVDVVYSNISISHTLTINYKYQNGASAAPSVTQVLEPGLLYNLTSPEIDGYYPDFPFVSGVMPDEDLAIDVVYSDTPLSHSLTINYLYSDNSPAAESVTQTIAAGAEYSIQSPEITGYTPSIQVVSGTMPEEDLTVNVYYAKAFYDLTVKYQHQDGTEAAPEIAFQYPAGFVYDVLSPAIPGYRPDKLSVSGEMPGEALTEIVTYTPVYPLTISYQYPDGSPAAEAYQAELARGDAYSIPSPTVSGHQPDKPSVFGEMPGEAVTETVTYSPIPYTLTVNYRFADGTAAAETHRQQLYKGDSYSVPSPEIPGYHPNQSAVTGVMPAEDVIATVTYREDSGGSGGTGPAGPGEGGEPGGDGGDSGGGSSGDDPFIPVLPPSSGNDPFIVPQPPPYSGPDPFLVPEPPPYSEHDPFIVRQPPPWSGYDPFAIPNKPGG